MWILGLKGLNASRKWAVLSRDKCGNAIHLEYIVRNHEREKCEARLTSGGRGEEYKALLSSALVTLQTGANIPHLEPTAELWRNQRGGIRHVKARYAATSVHIKCDQILKTPRSPSSMMAQSQIDYPYPLLFLKKMQSCQAPKRIQMCDSEPIARKSSEKSRGMSQVLVE